MYENTRWLFVMELRKYSHKIVRWSLVDYGQIPQFGKIGHLPHCNSLDGIWQSNKPEHEQGFRAIITLDSDGFPVYNTTMNEHPYKAIKALNQIFGVKLWANIGGQVTLALLLLCGQAYAAPQYVIDGDTISIGGVHYRLHGVDAPERNTRDGLEAKLSLSLIIGMDKVDCRPTGRKSYKRVVARCSTRTYPDIGAELIRRGYALDCWRYSRGEYKSLETIGAQRRLERSYYCE